MDQRSRQAVEHIIFHTTPRSVLEPDGPWMLEQGDGALLRDADGGEFLDALSGGVFAVLAGYGREEIARAMYEQAVRLPYTSPYGTTSPVTVDLAVRLAELAPGDVSASFFCSSGSEAVEAAIKMARQYHRASGDEHRYKVVSLRRGYHGATVGALSATGWSPGFGFLRRAADPVVPAAGYASAMPPYCHRCELGLRPDTCGLMCAATIEQAILGADPELVSCVILQPVLGTGGCIVPPPGYLARVRRICDAYGVLLVADEVVCGFGRTGRWFGVDHADVVPDIMVVAKGLTSGYAPMAAAMARRQVADRLPIFFDVHTYGGHPVSAAAALANLEIIDREGLLPGDLMYVGLENRDWPLHFGGLAVVDAGPLLGGDGALNVADREVLLERRLDRVPRLRQRIHDPGPLRGRPIWADDPHFSIHDHVNVLEVPAPGGEDELLRAATRLHERPLNPRRPRWELWFLTGLADGRVGILLKLHHSIADGLGAVAVMMSLFDLEPDAGDPAPTVWTPVPVPRSGALLADSLGRASRRARRAAVALARPRDLAGQAASLGRTTRGFFGTMAAPGSSINRRVRAGRRVGVVRLDVDDVRRVARARGGRVNDVVLTLWAAGLRGLLQARGEATEGVELVASVPVSLRSADESAVVANRVGVMTVPLPVGGADPWARLNAVVAATRQAKARQQPAAIMGFMARLASTPFGRRYTERQQAINVQVTNVPGPTEPIHLLGARVLEILPFISLAGNVGCD